MQFERTLDPTVRVPGRTYICPAHYGFNEVHDPNNGGHYPRLSDDVRCKNCVEWKDLCDKWITVGHPDVRIGSVRCMNAKDHEGSHLVDDLDGQRFSWSEESPVTQYEAQIFLLDKSGPVQIGVGDSVTFTLSSNTFSA